MDVLLIGDYPPPHGGIAVHVRQLHAALLRRSLRARVLDIGKGAHSGLTVEPARTPAELALALARGGRGALLHLHTSGNNPKSWMAALAVGLAPAAGRVITVHSGLSPAFLLRSAANRLLAWTALSRFDRIIAVSQAICDALAMIGVPPHKLAVVPPFIASELCPGEPPARFAEARARRQPLLAMAHHPSPVYGRELALAALPRIAARHPRVALAIFGPGLGGPELADAALRAGAGGLVEPFGELDHPQALAVVAGSDVFLRPTLADGDALSVREALALGTPCVASDASARPPGTLVFRGGDPDDLAAKVSDAVARGRVVAPQPDAAEAVVEIYRAVLAEAGAARKAAGGREGAPADRERARARGRGA